MGGGLITDQFRCPETIPTPRYPSPVSPLNPDQLAALKACIDTANELLRTVGTPRDRANREGLRLHFRQMRGLIVRMAAECGDEPVEVLGGVKDAGRDWVQIDTVGPQFFIPFDRICSVAGSGSGTPPAHLAPSLLDIDPCLRRNLILRFEETVAGNPELINIFFGLPLHGRLVSLIGRQVLIRTPGEAVEGRLCASEERFIQVQVAEDRVRQINPADVCFVRL